MGSRHLLATAFLLALAVVSLLSGAVFAAAGTPVAIPYCVLFASILVITAALGRSLRTGGRSDLAASVTTVVRDGAASTRIAHSSTQFALLIALLTACSALCVLASIGIAVHARGTEGFPVMSVVAGIIGAFCATFVVSAALGRVRWRIDRLPPVPMIDVDCRKFAVQRDALLDYLRHYVENPAARGELGTEAAIARAARP